MNLKLGTKLSMGRYEIMRFISAGGYGQTYEASDLHLQRRVAIKEFFPAEYCRRGDDGCCMVATADGAVALHVEQLKQRFIAEAKLLSTLSHPNIVNVSDVLEENDTAYYVMDYAGAVSVHDALVSTGSPLPEWQALEYVREVAEALRYLHANGILHLDVKPSNIMISGAEDGRVKLIDFGLSRRIDDRESPVTGVTPYFSSPEQMARDAKALSPASDIYSLGVTLFTMLVGRTPGEEISKLIHFLPQGTDDATRRLLLSAMNPVIQGRPRTVDELLLLLPSPYVIKMMRDVDRHRQDEEPPISEVADLSPSPEETKTVDGHPAAVAIPNTPNRATTPPPPPTIPPAGKLELSDNSDQSDNSDNSDKSDRSDRPDRSDRSDRSDKSEPVPSAAEDYSNIVPQRGSTKLMPVLGIIVFLIVMVAIGAVSFLLFFNDDDKSQNAATDSTLIYNAADSTIVYESSSTRNVYKFNKVVGTPYALGSGEVPQWLWKAVMNDSKTDFYFSGDNRPVEMVSYGDCVQFVHSLNSLVGNHFAIPTPEVWNRAAFGREMVNNLRVYPALKKKQWVGGSAECKTHDINTSIPDDSGFYDLSGNVSEWCSDTIARGGNFQTRSDDRLNIPPYPADGGKPRETVGLRLMLVK